MDCGPACLASVLEGFGINVAYGPLRDACQTDVDGTSIDAVEELAARLGLGAEQIMVPVDHLLLTEADALPAIVVVKAPSGFTHFVVVWSIVGPLVQVMDPAVGRRWVTRERFLTEVFVHSQPVPASAWLEWTQSQAFRGALERRSQQIGATGFVRRYLATNRHWTAVARLDAAVRFVDHLVSSGSLEKGSAARALESLCVRADARQLDEWSSVGIPGDASPSSGAADSTEVTLRGAVLVRLRGQSTDASCLSRDMLGPELHAALTQRPPTALAELARVLSVDGWLRPAMVVGGLALAALGIFIEALVLRGLVDVGHDLALPQQRWAAGVAVVALLSLLTALDLPVGFGALGVGRRLEIRFRAALLRRIPLLGERYFATRPLSDMAERAHAVHQLRVVGDAGWTLCRSTFELVVVGIGLVLLWVPGWPLVMTLVALAVLIPLVANSPLRERDLKARTHLGALSRFYLDALLGMAPVRAHGAERALRREHESLLVEWVRASRGRMGLIVATEAVQLASTLAVGSWLVIQYLARSPASGGVLLLAYWALRIPVLGDEIALVARRYPVLRSIVLRLAEPLAAVREREVTAHERLPHDRAGALTPLAISIELTGVHVVIGGHTILREVDLAVRAGEHVAIVGASGAGKSTLLALLLGLQRASTGRVLLDNKPLEGDHLDSIRRRTASLDPSVQLWNRTLLVNVLYGADTGGLERLAAAIDDAELRSLLQRLPLGMATPLGENGALVSGGEGQRVRLARALARGPAGLVILDEPFRGLDRSLRDAALLRLRHRFASATIILATHDVGATLNFDRVLVLVEGKIVEDAPPSELADHPASRYAGLLRAEREISHRLSGAGEWRRLRLEDGRIVPSAAAAPSGSMAQSAPRQWTHRA
jgi:ATP-binding cassette subfamily B protein